MQLVFYVSGHGFGHSSRVVELLHAIGRSAPGIRTIVRTSAPAWLFASTDAIVQPRETDSGIVQIDSLHLDAAVSAQQAAAFYQSFDRRVDEEATLLRTVEADLVLGDIPPLAFAAAARARVPSVAIGNFTWDWIYAAYPEFSSLAPDVIPTIRAAYATATRALRLPFHGGFETMASVVHDIPLIARRSTRHPLQTREILGLPSDRPVVLASFGMYGAALPWDALERSRAFSVVRFDGSLPHGLKYQDLVSAADVVVSKPGYGIVSECIANETALLYTSRGRFVEYDVFAAEMPRFLRCRYLSHEDLTAGRWTEAVETLLAEPKPVERPRIDGAEAAAAEIVDLVV